MPRPTNVRYPQCQFCASSTTPNMSRCSGCKAVQYCSKEHQTSDWYYHKQQCKPLQLALRKYQREADNLGAEFIAENEGYFWGLLETREYMRARFDVGYQLQHIVSNVAAKQSLGHFRDMLKLCRGDNLGVRDLVPGLCLRLGRDQECYDFIKWYGTEGERGDYDWGDRSLPFLNLRGEDVMEDLAWFKNKYAMAHNVGMLLLKLRMLLDLQDLKASQELGNIQALHADAILSIQDQLAHRSGIWKERREFLKPEGLDERIAFLKKQVDTWFDKVNKGNKYFFKGLMDHDKYLYATQEPYSMGSPEEMILLVQYCARSWMETDGAMEWARKKMQAA
ncbi:hypothetical protein BJ508DRAFT_239978 [Ascobolus immersus RN42]|uniref:MYND-type domain-containing protein n=1 Tax=Ascobolus immersus RN42 TaxID=1160509 RepID=A0A3N4I367_ASCIM|nr:hypothetical protein BJ508DRAFT_239978 [Ascobolus immersus RN42]